MKFLEEKLLQKNRITLFIIAVFLFWAKTLLAYYTEFTLGVNGLLQTLILWINPFATSVVLLSLSLYTRDSKKSNDLLLVMYFVISLLLYSNVLYYREFSDFMTLSTILGNIKMSGGTNLTSGLLASFVIMLRTWDAIYWMDFIFLTWLIKKRNQTLATSKFQNKQPFHRRYATAASLAGIALLFGNLVLAETDRPQLLTRTFDRNYIVKYLGINFYTGYDAFQTVRNNRIRARADEGDLTEVFEFTKENYVRPSEDYFGLAQGRNVFHIVLESTQEFVIDYYLEDEEGITHEVTPFLNEIVHDEGTLYFENFFHQTGQGKTSDSEMLSENSLFGLPEGSAFQSLGSNNTFHAAPKILDEELGYTTASFHGNIGTFWNRANTYRNLGYNYFFDSNFYDMSPGRTLDYGLKDKLFFKESVEYIEQLPQPFYAKFITLTNHFPYPLEEENASIPKANTADDTVNSYFQTVRYTDEALFEFFNWLKETGLYENSMFVFYGDHYGNSNMRNPHLAPLLGYDPEEWGDFENTQMQRVPLLFHIPGFTGGKTFDTYGGQVDLLPTLLHLLGVKTDSYLFMGQDLLSPENEQIVPLRNGNVLTPHYHFIGSHIYDAKTGELLDDLLTEAEIEELTEIAQHGRERLTNSDSLLSLDLLRFYQPLTLENWKENDYQYQNQMEYLKNHPQAYTSLMNQLDGKSTIDLYETNAPELAGTSEEFFEESWEEEKLSQEELESGYRLED